MYVRFDQRVLSTLSLVLLTTVHLAGCGEDLTPEDPHDHGSSSTEMMEVTQWSDSLEVFAEFPHLVAGRQAHLMLFLTLLPDGEPVAQGAINLVWTHEAGHHTSRVIRGTRSAGPGSDRCPASPGRKLVPEGDRGRWGPECRDRGDSRGGVRSGCPASPRCRAGRR